MEKRRKMGVSAPIAFGLAILLVVLVVGAGLLWLSEAEARLDAEEKASRLEKELEALKSECSTARNGSQGEGLEFSTSQDPILTGLEAQADIPECERPTTQPFAENLRTQEQNFFKNAKEGDVIVSFSSSKQIYLYRPSTSQLINQARLPSTPAQP